MTTRTNTLALIRKWSMAGAHGGDLDGHFASPVDILAAVAERYEETGSELSPPPVLMKSAGDEDWRPLAASNSA